MNINTNLKSMYHAKSELDKIINILTSSPYLTEQNLLKKFWEIGINTEKNESCALNAIDDVLKYPRDINFAKCFENPYKVAFNLGYIRQAGFLNPSPVQALKDAMALGHKLFEVDLISKHHEKVALNKQSINFLQTH